MKSWWNDVQAIVKSPEKFFKKMKTKGGYAEPLKFLIINIAIYGLIVGMFSLNLLIAVLGLVFAVVGGVIGLFIGAAIYQLILLLLGGKGKYESTVRVMSYSSVIYLLSWIPILNLFLMIYQIYLHTVGFARVHKISRGKALIGVLLPLIIVAVVMGILLSLFGAALFGAAASEYLLA